MKNGEDIPECREPSCSNPVGKTTRGKWKLHCSRVCMAKDNSNRGNEKRKQTCMEKYGAVSNLTTKETRDKIKDTNLKKYGVEHHMHRDDVKEKIKATCMETYGVDNPSKNEEIRKDKSHSMKAYLKENSDAVTDKRIASCMKKYGVSHYSKTNDYKDRYKITSLEKFGVDNPSKSREVKDKIIQTWTDTYGSHPNQRHISQNTLHVLSDAEWLTANKTRQLSSIANELQVSYYTISYAYKKHNIDRPEVYGSSLGEKELASFISSLGLTVVENSRSIITPKELDIYIPEKKIAIEFNGIYWHSENGGSKRHKSYHREKTQLCADKGIRLIHIWDLEYYSNKELVQSRIKQVLGFSDRIHGRKCTIEHVKTTEYVNFMNDNHIQGWSQAAIVYGLKYDGELVACMSFGKARYNKAAEYELIRYACKRGHTVVGGASKLFKHFIREQAPNTVISYSDRRWNTGNLYSKLGFVHTKQNKESYHYTYNYATYESRVKYQKHKLHSVLDTFDTTLSEWENMKNNGYDRVWDCGTDVYLWQSIIKRQG